MKLASLALLVLITTLALTMDIFQGPAAPSAIVKSIDYTEASVMIMETENQHHTIIWLFET